MVAMSVEEVHQIEVISTGVIKLYTKAGISPIVDDMSIVNLQYYLKSKMSTVTCLDVIEVTING